jgi:NADPH:quinone reductase-like Zn-dependent oxidoreductase
MKQDFGSVLQDQQFDCVYDCVGGQEQWEQAQQIMKQGGHFLTIAGDDPESEINVKSLVQMAGSMINRKFSSLFGPNKHSYAFHRSSGSTEALDDLRVNYIETGKVKPILDTVYDDWSQFIDMFEKSKSGKAQGKLVLKIVKD